MTQASTSGTGQRNLHC